MKIYNNINFVEKKFLNSVIAIGNFDGVHLGHQELLKKAYIFSRKLNKFFGIFTFDPLPKDFFNGTDNKILNIDEKVDIIKKFNNYKISSSKIRSLIQTGKVNLVNKIMGRPWSISGRVIKGKKFGRKIGFPTANIKIFNQIKPSFGVYSVKIIFNKKTYKGIANFGVRPTFGNSRPILEVNFFGKNHNFYNKNIKVLFIDFIRKEKKFKNSTMLVRQIKKDIKVAKISLNKK